MPIDINLDRRLRVAWHHYEIQIRDMKRNRRAFIQREMNNNLTSWDASELFNEEIKKLEKLRRIEIDHIHSLVQAENKEKQRMLEAEQEQRRIELEERREQRRTEREANKTQQGDQMPTRRSARVAKKNNI
jgi:hypothetical protein